MEYKTILCVEGDDEFIADNNDRNVETWFGATPTVNLSI